MKAATTTKWPPFLQTKTTSALLTHNNPQTGVVAVIHPT